MNNFFKKYFKNGVTKIPKETERAFFFYASMVLIFIYLMQRFSAIHGLTKKRR
jgi:hypothetical protein